MKGLLGRIHSFENVLVAFALFLMAFFPLYEIISRLLGTVGIPGTTDYVRHLTLWVGMLGAIVASREKQHLSLHAGLSFLSERVRGILQICTAHVSVAVCAALTWGGWEFVLSELTVTVPIAGWIPQWVAIVIIPIGFGLVALRTSWNASEHWAGRFVALLGVGLAALVGFGLTPEAAGELLIPAISVLIISGILGSPIFTIIGGCAVMLFFADDIMIAAIPIEAYRIVASPVLPTIPLFTLAGYILSEGGASKRFVRLFRTWFGWLPGGTAVATVLVCAFFTTFTGASGVTILALGGLLLPVLLKNGFTDRFSIGLLTSSGSLGLLFPPSLAVILYGVVATVPIDNLFLAGLIPGMILLIVMALYGVQQGLKSEAERVPFKIQEARDSLLESKWDLALPIIVIVGIFGGFTTLVEAAAITVIYALITQVFIYRDIEIKSGLLPIFVKCATLVGGILIILSVALGLTSWLIDAEIPAAAAEWAEASLESKFAFLLLLNLFLLVVGCLMDIFSAILVVVPLIVPIGAVFGIHPLHLGVIFLANLELGYITPPVGMNLFLASYRFDRSLLNIYRDTMSFFLIRLAIVLLVTYVPILSLGLLD